MTDVEKESMHETIRNICQHYDRMLKAQKNAYEQEIEALTRQVKAKHNQVERRGSTTEKGL